MFGWRERYPRSPSRTIEALPAIDASLSDASADSLAFLDQELHIALEDDGPVLIFHFGVEDD